MAVFQFLLSIRNACPPLLIASTTFLRALQFVVFYL